MGKNEVVARNGTESLQLIKSPECRKRTLRTADYFPFGLPSRTFQPSYKWGFNGKENDREVLTGGRFQDYGFRAYRPDLGRFFAVDPLKGDYPELTTYQFASNTPIQAIDLDGLEMYVATYRYSNGLPSSVELKAISAKSTGKIVEDMAFKIGADPITNSKVYVRHLDSKGKEVRSPEERNELNKVEKQLSRNLSGDNFGNDAEKIYYDMSDQKNGQNRGAKSEDFESGKFKLVSAKGKLGQTGSSWQGDENGSSHSFLTSGSSDFRSGKGDLLYVSNATKQTEINVGKGLGKMGVKLPDIIVGKKDTKTWERKDAPSMSTFKLEKKP